MASSASTGHTYSGAITTAAMASGLSSPHSLRSRGSLQSTPHASRSTSYAAVKAGSILMLHDSRDGRRAFYLPYIVIKCIPLTKQHMQICATCPLCLHPRRPIKQCPDVFLLDGETGLDMSNFRVLWVRLIHDKQQDGSKTVQARVFSATDKDDRWVSLSTRVMDDAIIPIGALDYLRCPSCSWGARGGSL